MRGIMISCLGKHNQIKCLCFVLLNGNWYRSHDLAFKVNTSDASARTSLAKWVRWQLVTLWLDQEGNRKYKLSSKGYRWLSRHWDEFPITRWVSELPPYKQEYFSFLNE